jgi:hypothetical protein
LYVPILVKPAQLFVSVKHGKSVAKFAIAPFRCIDHANHSFELVWNNEIDSDVFTYLIQQNPSD